MAQQHLRKGIEYSRNLMTVRIAKILGLDKILDLSKKLEYLWWNSWTFISFIGAAETTLINLTSAYAPFVNGGKKVNQIWFLEFKIEEEKQFLNWKNRKCLGCDKFISKTN